VSHLTIASLSVSKPDAMTIRAIERIGIALALVPEAETSFTVGGWPFELHRQAGRQRLKGSEPECSSPESTVHETFRRRPLYPLAEIGGHDAARVAAIALYDEEDSIRQAAVDALGDIGDETAIGFLQQLLNDHSRSIRESAASYLSELRDLDMSVR